MGNSASKAVGYKELRNSIPGSLVHEEDYKLFYSLCKVESPRTISNILLPSTSQLFYVVLSGEVVVHLSSPDVKHTAVATFGAGETIHFFNAHLRGNSSLATFDYADECLHNGDIKLCLSFKSVGKATGKVIGIDRRSMDEFLLKARANTHALTSFVNMNMVSLFQGSPFCKTMTPEQVLHWRSRELRTKPLFSVGRATSTILALPSRFIAYLLVCTLSYRQICSGRS